MSGHPPKNQQNEINQSQHQRASPLFVFSLSQADVTPILNHNPKYRKDSLRRSLFPFIFFGLKTLITIHGDNNYFLFRFTGGSVTFCCTAWTTRFKPASHWEPNTTCTGMCSTRRLLSLMKLSQVLVTLHLWFFCSVVISPIPTPIHSSRAVCRWNSETALWLFLRDGGTEDKNADDTQNIFGPWCVWCWWTFQLCQPKEQTISCLAVSLFYLHSGCMVAVMMQISWRLTIIILMAFYAMWLPRTIHRQLRRVSWQTGDRFYSYNGELHRPCQVVCTSRWRE